MSAIRNAFTSLLATALLPGAAVAQQAVVTGSVRSESALEPLVGVEVSIEGTPLSAVTDAEGRYRFDDAPEGEATVRARMIGYQSQARTVQVTAGQVVTVDFELGVTAVDLDELVVTVTGPLRTREVGNSISQIDAEDVAATLPANLTSLIRGRSTGVTVRQSSGSVGTASAIKIRGATSLGLDNTPLVYIDGARIDNSNLMTANFSVGGQNYSRLDDINPEDIESIEIVKGPAAATLYGTEAGAGVLRITTKRGQSPQARWRFWAEQGANWDATDWWSMAWNPAGGVGLEALTGVAAATDTVYDLNLLEGAGPFATPFRTGRQQGYGASVTGGAGENVTYFISGSYRNDEGNLPSNDLDRYTARANVGVVASEKITVDVSTGFSSSRTRLPENDNNLFGVVGNALGNPWAGPITRPDPTTGGAPVETCFLAYELARATGEPLAELTDALSGSGGQCESPYFVSANEDIFLRDNFQQLERFTGSGTVNWRPFDFLTNRLTIGYDEYSTQTRGIVPVDPELPFGDESRGDIARMDLVTKVLTLEAYSSAEAQLNDDVRSRTTVGVQFTDDQAEFTTAIGRRFPAGSPTVGNSVENEGGDGFGRTKTLGVFVEQQIGYRDRLFVTPRVRFDDNSAFGDELGVTVYPGVGVSWVASDEAWFPNFFDTFRFHGAWGQAGKQPGTNDALGLLTPVPVAFRNEDVLGVTPTQPANAELEPERDEEIELGFESSVLAGRLGFDVTYYNKTSKNVIVQRDLAPSTGFPEEVFENIGEMTNRGVELGIDAIVLDRPSFSWTTRALLSTNSNEITALPQPIVFGAQRHTEGSPFASYFAEPVTLVDGEAVVDTAPVFLGRPDPKWDGSFSNIVRLFGRVTLYAQVDFAGGHQLHNGLEEFSCGLFGGGGLDGACPAIFETTPDGEFTDEAKIKQAAAAAGSEAPFIYDADYAKLRDVSVSLDLPAAWAQRIGAQGATITLRGSNLATWTSYEGTDPEVNFAGDDGATRSQLWTVPPARTFVGRVTLTF